MAARRTADGRGPPERFDKIARRAKFLAVCQNPVGGLEHHERPFVVNRSAARLSRSTPERRPRATTPAGSAFMREARCPPRCVVYTQKENKRCLSVPGSEFF